MVVVFIIHRKEAQDARKGKALLRVKGLSQQIDN